MFNKDIKILIVEDEVFAMKYLLSILKSLGHSNIYEASSSKDALEIVKSVHIDIVFMDINIKGAIDGIECSKILNQEYFLPTIYTTAYGDTQTIQEATQSNLFGYLIKPFEAHNVEATLKVAENLINIQNIHKKTIEKNIVDFGNNEIYNIETRTFLINHIPISLTKRELVLLDLFCKSINQNISYETLKEVVWNNSNISNSTIRDTVSRLKKKIQNLPLNNVVNFGYILSL